MDVSGGLQTEYSLVLYMGQADFRPNIHWCNAQVRQIADLIFIGEYRCQADCQLNICWCTQGSGGLPTEYSFGV
jgi:hypothetical protein